MILRLKLIVNVLNLSMSIIDFLHNNGMKMKFKYCTVVEMLIDQFQLRE